MSEKANGKVVSENPDAAGVNAALPFSPQDVGRAIWLRRPARIQKKTGFTLHWDAWHANFVVSARGESPAKEWYVMSLFHWTEKELAEADKNLFISGGSGVEGLLQERERFAAWLAKHIEEEGLPQKWAEDYANVMKKMPEWAPCFTKEPDLL